MGSPLAAVAWIGDRRRPMKSMPTCRLGGEERRLRRKGYVGANAASCCDECARLMATREAVAEVRGNKRLSGRWLKDRLLSDGRHGVRLAN